jgi:hypothetical protein
VSEPAIIALTAVGIPLCLFRLWWIWWQSTCRGCGLEHRACVCPPDDQMMRPRR